MHNKSVEKHYPYIKSVFILFNLNTINIYNI